MKPQTFRDLMRMVHGFEAAKILLVANDLDLFCQLGEGRTADELANSLDVDARALALVLNALAALKVLEKEGELFRNTMFSARYLAGEDHRGHILRHVHHCWDSWNDLAGVLRRGAPDRARETLMLHDEEAWNRDFIRGMDDVTRDLAPQVVPQLDLSGARTLLDVGGGPGTYARLFLETFSQLEAVTIFDLPLTLKVARERLQDFPRKEDVRLLEGDFDRDALGCGYDAVWISQVFHAQDEAGCRMLIDKSWQALNSGGQLIVHEFLLDETKTAPLTAALFAVHMLVMTDGGRSYSGQEVAGWLKARGFVAVEVKSVSDDTGVVRGLKP